MTVKLGVTLYSMTNEWLAGKYTLGGLIDEVGKRRLGPGIELIGFQSLRGFPANVSKEDKKIVRDAIERNGLAPTSLAANADIGLKKGAFLTSDESIEYLRPQVELAAELGFPIVRTQVNFTPEVLEKIEPIAAKAGVHLGMEVHAPEGPNTPKILGFREVYAKIDSEHLGFIPDFSSCMRAIPPGMLNKLRNHGLSEDGVALLVAAWKGEGPPFARYGAFAEKARSMGEPELPIGEATLVFTMFGREPYEGWSEVFHQVRHIHGKFYDVDDDLTSPSIDYEGLMHLFGSCDRTFTMSTEWEGHSYLDMDEQDAFEMVERHQAMCRKFLEPVQDAA